MIIRESWPELGDAITELRRGLNLSQTELAAHTSVSRPQITNIELGAVPSILSLSEIADHLGVSLSQLIKMAEDREGTPFRKNLRTRAAKQRWTINLFGLKIIIQ